MYYSTVLRFQLLLTGDVINIAGRVLSMTRDGAVKVYGTIGATRPGKVVANLFHNNCDRLCIVHINKHATWSTFYWDDEPHIFINGIKHVLFSTFSYQTLNRLHIIDYTRGRAIRLR